MARAATASFGDLNRTVDDLDFGLDDHGPKFLEARRSARRGDVAIFGVPFDSTTSFRPGTRFGPDQARAASLVLESYSPELDADLADVGYCDLGNLEVPMGPPEPMVAHVRQLVGALLEAGLTPLMLGGEHSVTSGAVEAVHARHPELLLVQLDAHADLRESYLGERHSHACTMRRCLQTVGPRGLIQVGIRSGTREEIEEIRRERRLVPPGDGMAAALAALIAERGERPIYLTVDLDVFDPGLLSGTGTPEPGGIDWRGFSAILDALPTGSLVAADVVELAGGLDPSGASSVYAAKVVREVALRLSGDRRIREER